MSNSDGAIQLCKVGDKLYRVAKLYKRDEFWVEPITITSANFYTSENHYNDHWVYHDDKNRYYFNSSLNISCFKTEKEAKDEIQRRYNIKKKRQLLREYEKELNKKFNMKDHYIVK